MLLLVLVATRTLRGVRPQTIVPPSGGGAEGYSAEGVSPASLVVQDADGSFDRTLTVDFTSSLREPLLNVRVVGCLPSDETMQPALVLGSKGAKCHVRTLAAPVSVVLKDSTHLHNSTTSSSSRRRHARKGRRRLLAAGDAAHYRLRYEITFEVIDPEATHYVYLRVEYTSMADALMDLEKHRRVADDHSPAVGTEVAGANPLVVPPDVEGWKKAAQAAAARGSKAAREALERGRKVPRLCGPGEEAAGHGHWKHSGDNLWFDPTLAWNSADNVHNGNGKMEADPELDGHPPSTSESATSAAAANANANANAASAPKLLVCDGDEKVCTKKPCVACDHCDPHPGMRPALEAMAAWRWVPRRCVPRRYSSSEAAECLRRVGGVTITGDSVAAQLVDRLRCAVGVPGPFNQLVVHGKSPKGIAEYPSRPWGQFSEGMRKINLNHTRGRPTPPPVTRREKREEGGGVSFGGGSGGGSEAKRGVLALNPAGLWQCGRGTLSSAQAGLESLLTPDQVGNYDRVVLVATNTVRDGYRTDRHSLLLHVSCQSNSHAASHASSHLFRFISQLLRLTCSKISCMTLRTSRAFCPQTCGKYRNFPHQSLEVCVR